MTTFLAAVFVFGLLIFFHELGHFSIAKLVGVKVYEFSLGFGTKILSHRKGDTQYNLRLFPLGGFVRMAGMDNDEDVREAKKEFASLHGLKEEEVEDTKITHLLVPEKAFNNKTILQRMAVIFAGPFMNLVLAVLLFSIVFGFYGIPSSKPVPVEKQTTISQVLADGAAQKAGFKSGDKIVAINGKKVAYSQEVTNTIHKAVDKETQKGKLLTFSIIRMGQEKLIKVAPIYNNEIKGGRIGILLTSPEKEFPGVINSIWLGMKSTANISYIIFTFLGKMFMGLAPFELGGPVRVVSEIGKAADTGLDNLLYLAAFLSINIGLFNLLPFPALDGSRLIFLGFEGLRGKPVDPSKENFIHIVGLALLLLLMVVITFQDIKKIL